MKFWQKVVTSLSLTIGIAGAAPAVAADAEKSGERNYNVHYVGVSLAYQF